MKGWSLEMDQELNLLKKKNGGNFCWIIQSNQKNLSITTEILIGKID